MRQLRRRATANVSKVLAVFAGVVLLTGCASGYGSGPPGGREDHTPPKILKITPDSGALNARPGAMVVQFDGVISERPGGQGASLADLVVVSPRDGQPKVDWHRDKIAIHPRHGWRKNTAYTVTLLPGFTDLHGNVANSTTRLTFGTGATIPATTLTGTVFDWMRGTPLINAVVEAVAHPDTSLVYVGTTDSLGKFSLRGLAPGTYLVRAYDDQSHNHALDPREPFDSSTVSLATTTWTEFLAFAHDSSGPRLNNVQVQDSLTLYAFFDIPVDPAFTMDASVFTLTAADSSRVAITSVTPIRQDSEPSNRPAVTPPTASGVPAPILAPSKPAVPAPRPSKPLIYREVSIKIAKPLLPKTTYTVQAINVRSPLHVAATSSKSFTTAAPVPRDTTNAAKPSGAHPTPAAPTAPIRP